MPNLSLNNSITPFTTCDNFVRGWIIKLDTELNKILIQHNYPPLINRILSEMILVASLIGSQFKEEIILTVQLQAKKYFKYITVDFEGPGNIRAYAALDDEFDLSEKNYQDLVHKNILLITIDRRANKNQRYQGIIDIKNYSICSAIEHYFTQSEQIKTSIKLAYGTEISNNMKHDCAGGIMIQQIPGDLDDENWNLANIYFSTLRDDELIDPKISSENLLYSLYHEVNVYTYGKINIQQKCRCSKEKMLNLLSSFSSDQLQSMIVGDSIEITCQFCNSSIKISNEELKEQLKDL